MSRLFSAICLTLSIVLLGLTASFAATPKIYMVSHAGAGDPFWKIEFKGARDAAKLTGVDLTILAPEIPNDITRQRELLDQAIAAKPSGILTTVPQYDSFAPLLRKAKAMGIPVVIFNAIPDNADPQDIPYLAYVGMNDFLAGQAAAKKILSAKPIGKRIAVAVQQVGITGLMARLKGIRSILEPRGIWVDMLDVTSEAQTIAKVVSDYLNSTTQLSAIISLGPVATHAIAPLLEKYPSLYFASFDVSPLTVKLIESERLAFTIDQQPYMQSYLSVILLDLAARYALTPTDINTGVGIIDSHNVQTVKALSKEGLR